MKSHKRFLTRLFVIVLVVVIVNEEFVLAYPPSEGDWVVTETESHHDQIIVLNGNLIVKDGGSLTFRNVTLKMNCAYNGQYNIEVNGGEFYVLDGSIITSVDPEIRFMFWVGHASTFRMNNSELHACGWNDEEEWGLNISCNDAIIENSLLSHNFRGVNTAGEGVIVRSNNVTENDHHGIFSYKGGSIICNNYITQNGVNGIESSDRPVIRNNTIALNDVGIVFSGSGAPIIQDNFITLNEGEGIVCSGTSSALIQGNEITLNKGWAGIVIKTGGEIQGTIQGNIIANNSGDGIHTGGDLDLLIQGNIIASNEETGILCQDNLQAEIHWNDIYDHKMDISTDHNPSVNVNATYNYWGDTLNIEKISEDVLYDPWLTESILPSIEITIDRSIDSVVMVSAEVLAPNGVDKVEFYTDSQLEYGDYDTPYEWNWDTTQYTETEHEVTSKVHDIFGLKVSTSVIVLVDNTPPTVSIKEPTEENVCSEIIRVSVNATDNLELSNVYVSIDDAEWSAMTYDPSNQLWKYDVNTTALSDGQHIIMALALDKADNRAGTSIMISTDNSPPAFTFESPQSGLTVGETLKVSVIASDASEVLKIEFYVDNVLVYTVTDTPYQWLWDTRKYPNGEYTISVKAYDTVGNIGASEARVTVNNVELPWWQTQVWTIVEVLIGVSGLALTIIALVRRGKTEEELTAPVGKGKVSADQAFKVESIKYSSKLTNGVEKSAIQISKGDQYVAFKAEVVNNWPHPCKILPQSFLTLSSTQPDAKEPDFFIIGAVNYDAARPLISMTYPPPHEKEYIVKPRESKLLVFAAREAGSNEWSWEKTCPFGSETTSEGTSIDVSLFYETQGKEYGQTMTTQATILKKKQP